MNYTQAVEAAKKGEEEGFTFLYEQTYKSKYYLAMKYVRNEEIAKDVLQDAYMKAFLKLDTLENPEAFAGWLGIIVANTAKNELKKNNPMLFTELEGDSEEERFEYQIEDENIDNQPEMAYSQKETQELVHEFIDSLSEEQRICILMFHIEQKSIQEIADALECSENTVKSRLNYGRKNIKAKAEELQKKGYKLYGVAPITLFLHLLMSEEKEMEASGICEAVGGELAQNISKELMISRTSSKGAVASAAKYGFMHTVIGKITVVVVGICIVGGAAAVSATIADSKEPTTEDTVNISTEIETEEQVDDENKDEFLSVADDMYPSLLKGNLTEEQLSFILAASPGLMSEKGLTSDEMNEMMNYIAMGYQELGIRVYGNEWDYDISAEDANRFISVITDYRFAEGNDIESVRGWSISENVQGDNLPVCIAGGVNVSAKILEAKCKSDEMQIIYEYTWHSDDGEENKVEKRVAKLQPQKDGLYQIKQIWTIKEDNDIVKIQSGEWNWKMAYRDILFDAPKQTYGDADFVIENPDIYYVLCEITGDSVPELLVVATGEEYPRSPWLTIYSYSNETLLFTVFLTDIPPFFNFT